MYIGLIVLVGLVLAMFIALNQLGKRKADVDAEADLRLKAEYARIVREEPDHPDAKISEAEFILKHRDFARAGAESEAFPASQNTRQIQIFIVILILLILLGIGFDMGDMDHMGW